jgi:hypothetical protein
MGELESAVIVWSPARLRRSRPSSPGGTGGATTTLRPQISEPLNARYVFTRADLQPVLGAIRRSLGDDAVPLDSPLRLQDALAAVIRGLGGHGEVVVNRSPAALVTPEYWQIGLAGLDAPTHSALTRLFRTGRP